jgi:hypothetical protein
MLILSTYHPLGELFTPDEINSIKGFIRGGGICLIVADHSGVMDTTAPIEQLLTELKLEFSFINDGVYETFPYIDISPDPITVGVTSFTGKASGRFEVFGNGVSIIRGKDVSNGLVYTAVCKSLMGE